MTRLFRCMKCRELTTKVGCKVYTLNGRLKGKICEWCAARPPKYKTGIMSPRWACEQGKPRRYDESL